jgi:ketosteroid isomerase-like protein
MFHPGAHLVFPGSSSFGGEHVGKREIGAWFNRFASLHPTMSVHDVTVAGPPWKMRVAVHFSDRIPLADGPDYENKGIIYARLRWGRVVEERSYLDTEKVATLDARLGLRPPA